MTYLEFGAKCRLVPHNAEKPLHPLEVVDVQRDVLDSHMIPFMVGSATAG